MQRWFAAILAAGTLMLTACGPAAPAEPPAQAPAPPAPAPAPPALAAAPDEKPPVPPPTNPEGAGATGIVKAAVQPLPQPHPFPYFAAAAHGWLAAGNAILATADGGRSWSQVYEAGSQVRSFHFNSPRLGWAVTAGGLLSTRDGGKTWATVWTGNPEDLGSIRFVDGEHGWAVAKNAVKVTGDGGRTWAPADVADPCGPRSGARYSFTGTAAGWALCAGQPGVGMQSKWLYKTEDAGRNWQLIAAAEIGKPYGEGGLPRGGYVSGFFFLDEVHGWISHSRGGLIATADGGKTWRGVRIGPGGEQFLGIDHFVSPREGFVTTRQGTYTALVRTEDGGATWTQVHPPLTPARSFTSGGPFIPLQFFDAQNGSAAGTVLDMGAVLKTADGGRTWTQIASLRDERVLALRWSDPQHGWALTERWVNDRTERSLVRTADGGATWSRVAAAGNAEEVYGAISFVDALTGFVGTNRGRLLATRDGGQTFAAVAAEESRRGDYQFVDAQHGWAVRAGQIEATADGGRSWAPVSLGFRVWQYHLLSGGNAWVVAADCQTGECKPALFSTANGGQTWTRYDLGAIRPTAAAAADTTHVWLEDEAGHLYATADGGRSWTQLQ